MTLPELRSLLYPTTNINTHFTFDKLKVVLIAANCLTK